MSGFRASVLVVAASVLVPALPAVTGAGDGYVVVVNQANPVHLMSGAEVSRLFLKRHGDLARRAVAVPYDLSCASPTRKAFTQGVHGKPLWVVVAFWQQEIASGRTQPPAVCATEEAAVQAVSGNAGAVAYVSDGLALPPGVKVLTVEP
jgi:ABC-type phosphate transport system substrate-binding protein